MIETQQCNIPLDLRHVSKSAVKSWQPRERCTNYGFSNALFRQTFSCFIQTTTVLIYIFHNGAMYANVTIARQCRSVQHAAVFISSEADFKREAHDDGERGAMHYDALWQS